MYYKVMVKGGHCGTKRSSLLTFAIKAKDAFTAMQEAQAKPGVKHSAFPILCQKIERIEYTELRKISAYTRAGLK